uniref:Uncharacterized protein n=1 Tax=Rhizophora mucronata TaxID=61149 RepID=A0A2P2QJA0_RHIMU
MVSTRWIYWKVKLDVYKIIYALSHIAP